jgi:hypothetical protein
MIRRGWWLLAIGLAFLVDGARVRAEGRIKHQLQVTPASSTFSCAGSTACFDVTSGQNITHIFVDVENGCANADDFQVYVDGNLVERLHDQGGPCGNGDDAIARQVWFPLSGNECKPGAICAAQVCVTVGGGTIPSQVRVGAKSADQCVSNFSGGGCSSCDPVYPGWTGDTRQ